MKKHWGIVAAVLAGFAGTAQASSLVDRGWYDASGNHSATQQAGYAHMVYEQDRNLTWLDVNSGYLNFYNAARWAANGTWGGHDDWRLPTSGSPLFTTGFMADPYFPATTSEMEDLWGWELGNRAITSLSYSAGYPVVPPSPNWGGLINSGPFQNLLEDGYWLGVTLVVGTIPYDGSPVYYVTPPSVFDAAGGFQVADLQDWQYLRAQYLALAVRTGDAAATPSAVPLPGALWLFASALLGLTGAARRRSLPG